MKLNITRMDSKGRISIPMALRHHMNLSQGDELMLRTEEKELRLMPLCAGNTELNIMFKKSANVSEVLSRIMQVLAEQEIGIINSEVHALNGAAGWQAVIDADDHKKLKREISRIRNIKDFSVKRNSV